MSTKISQLTSATDVTASDLMQIVDVEDGVMAPSGTNKKCTAQLMANELGKLTNITATGSTTPRSLANRFADVVNVKDFGAVGDGVSNDTIAFQNAANYATLLARDYMTSFPVSKAKVANIYVPSGNYIVSSAIKSEAQIVWNLNSNVIISVPNNLGGSINRDGRHINATHTGYVENSTTLSLRANKNLGDVGGVYGIVSLDQISIVGPPHSVTLQIDNDTRDYTQLTGTTYTQTSVTYTNSPDLSNIKTGTFITTQGSPKYIGQVTSVNTASKTITIANSWRPHNGVSGAVGTPTNGDIGVVDYYDKIWGQNTNVFLRSNSETSKAAGYELGVLNQQSNSPVLDLSVVQSPSMWGFDAVNLGTYKSSVAFVARAGATENWRTGFASQGNEIAFQAIQKSGFTTSVGFSYDVDSGTAFRCNTPTNGITYQVLSNGSVELGSKTASGNPYIDFNSSGGDFDYDSRILGSGGSGFSGQGILQYYAGFHRFLGSVGGASGESFRVAAIANAVNFVQATGAITGGSGPVIQAEGSDSNIDLRLVPKGSGKIRFGTNNAITTETLSSYIEIKDAAGNIRKLAVVS